MYLTMIELVFGLGMLKVSS